MPAGPLAILPLPGNRSSIVWSERTDRAAEIAAMDDAAYLEALRPAFGDFLGQIELAGARYSYPLSLSIADAFVAPRLALVGDAAHGVHPIAGQGLNLGLRDVAALAEVLSDAQRRGEDIAAPDVLARYQTGGASTPPRWPWPRMRSTVCSRTTIPSCAQHATPEWGWCRPRPRCAAAFIREAAGLTGDLPRLLQGRAL
jgi:2-octaprenyl-6-methoxyphenol hydroxylase